MKLFILLLLTIFFGIKLSPFTPRLFVAPMPTTVDLAVLTTPTPTPSDSQVIQEIVTVFGKEDRHTIKKMIDIAYAESGLRWNAHGVNTNNTEDFGVFQINSVHIKRFGPEFKTDYKENVRVAYALYKRQGFVPWVAAKKLGYAL